MKLLILPSLLYIARLWPFSTPHDCWRKSVCLPMYSAAPEVITFSLPLKQYFRTTSFYIRVWSVGKIDKCSDMMLCFWEGVLG